MSENRCVCCGEIIPEGKQVCPNCSAKSDKKERYVGYCTIDKLIFTSSGTLKEMTDWAEKQLTKGARDISIWLEKKRGDD